MRRAVSLVAATLFLTVVATAATLVRPDSEEDAVRTTVELYFQGMMEASPETLREAFHPDARLIGLGRDGQVMIIPFETWAAGWEGREPRDPEKYVNAIVDVDLHGTAASAKTDLKWPNVRYIDYLSLLKVDGEWVIVNKIWTEEAPGS
jgi:hypothetical protein